MKGQFTVKEYSQNPDRPWVANGFVNGSRKRYFFATKAQAEEKARLENLQLREFGHQAANISGELRIDALAAQQILAPLGVSLIEAAKFYAEQRDHRAKSVTVAEAWAQYKAHMEHRFASGTLKKRSLETVTLKVGDFVDAFASEQICDLSSQRISQWLHALPYAPKSKDTYRTNASGLFTHALKCGWIQAHPMTGGKVDSKEFQCAKKRPGILSVEVVARMLEIAEADLVPAIALGAFAGLRPSEIHKMDWKDIHWENKEIDIDPLRCKTARYRFIPMHENLIEWLELYRQSSGPIFRQSVGRLSMRISRAGRAAGLAKWPSDGLRHSYGSYEYARNRSADDTTAQMGNSKDVFFSNYRNRVRREEAVAYFGIRPSSEAQAKVVAIAA
jgi:integrase